jgi:hypothetical protein
MPTYTTKPAVPVEALRLNEDIRALQRAIELVRSLEASNIAYDINNGYQIIREVITQLRDAERFATQHLRVNYLAPRKKRLNG